MSKSPHLCSMQCKAVIYDMDGVLIDSEPFWREAELLVFPQYGIHITEDDCRSTAGLRIVEVVEHWKKFFALPHLNAEAIAYQVVDEVIRLVKNSGSALPGVMESLAYFSAKNIPLAVATSSPQRLMQAVLERLAIAEMFTVTMPSDGLRYAKPHPEIFLKTAANLHVQPTDCLVIEDTINGMIAAKSARMTVWVVPEAVAQNDARFALADRKLNSLLEILEQV